MEYWNFDMEKGMLVIIIISLTTREGYSNLNSMVMLLTGFDFWMGPKPNPTNRSIMHELGFSWSWPKTIVIFWEN